MKVRFAGGRVRVRLDDLELKALLEGQSVQTGVSWPGGGWWVCLDPLRTDVQAEGGGLTVGMRDLLAALADPAQEGVSLQGPPRLRIEKEFGPQHA